MRLGQGEDRVWIAGEIQSGGRGGQGHRVATRGGGWLASAPAFVRFFARQLVLQLAQLGQRQWARRGLARLPAQHRKWRYVQALGELLLGQSEALP